MDSQRRSTSICLDHVEDIISCANITGYCPACMLNSQWVLVQPTSLIGQCICLFAPISKMQPKLRKVNTGYNTKVQKEQIVETCFYHLEKAACMFAEDLCKCLVIV